MDELIKDLINERPQAIKEEVVQEENIVLQLPREEYFEEELVLKTEPPLMRMKRETIVVEMATQSYETMAVEMSTQEISTQEISTQSDKTIVLERATQSDETMVVERATQSDEIKVEEIATQSNEAIVIERATQSDETIVVERATQSDTIRVTGQSTQSDESMNDINEKTERVILKLLVKNMQIHKRKQKRFRNKYLKFALKSWAEGFKLGLKMNLTKDCKCKRKCKCERGENKKK